MIGSGIILLCSLVLAAYWAHYLCAYLLVFDRYPSAPRLWPDSTKKI